MMLKLYDYSLSGNCYKVRLLAQFLGLPYETQPVDFYPGFEHKSDWFLAINPLGQLPVLDDDGLILRDAQAILVYLASKYDRSRQWYPLNDADKLGRISMWLAFADAITGTVATARLHDAMYFSADVEKCREGAHRLFRIFDEHLWFAEQEDNQWVCPGDQPTIADIACFPYIQLSDEGGVSRRDYPAIRRWCDRVMRLPGFKPMAGMCPLPLMQVGTTALPF